MPNLLDMIEPKIVFDPDDKEAFTLEDAIKSKGYAKDYIRKQFESAVAEGFAVKGTKKVNGRFRTAWKLKQS